MVVTPSSAVRSCEISKFGGEQTLLSVKMRFAQTGVSKLPANISRADIPVYYKEICSDRSV